MYSNLIYRIKPSAVSSISYTYCTTSEILSHASHTAARYRQRRIATNGDDRPERHRSDTSLRLIAPGASGLLAVPIGPALGSAHFYR